MSHNNRSWVLITKYWVKYWNICVIPNLKIRKNPNTNKNEHVDLKRIMKEKKIRKRLFKLSQISELNQKKK